MKKEVLHVIPHSHWDREWYMSFEQHRMRLVDLFDTLIALMESDPGYTYYHMDGQYITVEDYLEIRPEMQERLYALIRADRIQIGPWYVLQDEYLTSGEANVRNMLYGMQMCRKIGAEPVMTGYFPDAFGNISQAPQILRGFGIDNAAFGRGIGAILEDNKVDPNATSYPSEITWRSPDGSEVIGIMFSPWYNNAMELPTEREALKEKLSALMRGLRGAGITGQYLALNGCDHQPVQTNLHQVIDTAKELFGEEFEIRQSNFRAYADAIRPYQDRFSYIEGEINGQRTAGQVPLVDTASAHVPLKQKNHRGQNALERTAEPLCVMAAAEGKPYPRDELLYAWKKLMQNHPHDSICSCSCDDVAREMDIRFDKSYQVASYLRDESMQYIADRIDTSAMAERNITVFHTEPFRSTECITCTVDFPQGNGVKALSVFDEDGNAIPVTVKSMGCCFTYTLPKDRFRQPEWVDRFALTFPVTMEGIGYRTFRVERQDAKTEKTVFATPRGAENEYLSFTIAENGTLTVTDKRSGMVYASNNYFEDVADQGDLYNFRPVQDDIPLTTENAVASVRLLCDDACRVCWEVTTAMDTPLRRDANGASPQSEVCKFVTRYTLCAGVARIDVETDYCNTVENHRVRAMFRPEIACETVLAEGQFDVLDREITPYPTWENPCYCQRMQAFFALFDGKRGLMVASRGQNEYEILRDGHNTMALTLLRCVGQIGDWGYFPTPLGQCKGDHTFRYSIIPFDAEHRAEAYHQGYSFNGEPFAAVYTKSHGGTLPSQKTYVTCKGDFFGFSALKTAESDDSMILRMYNADNETHDLNVVSQNRTVSVSDLAETEGSDLDMAGSEARISVTKKKIITLRIR